MKIENTTDTTTSELRKIIRFCLPKGVTRGFTVRVTHRCGNNDSLSGMAILCRRM
jgi:hypothetical protein